MNLMRWLKPKVKESVTAEADPLARIFSGDDLRAVEARIAQMPVWRWPDAVQVARVLGQCGMRTEDIVGPGFEVVFGLIEGSLRMNPEHAAEAVAVTCAVGNLQGGAVKLSRNVVEVCVRGR